MANLWKGLGHFGRKIGTGALRSIEGIVDFSVGQIADIFGNDEYAEKLMGNDWIDYGKVDEDFNEDSGFWKVAGDIGGGLGSSLPSLALSFIPYAGPALSIAAAGVGAAGTATSEAYKESGELGHEEWAYGTASGAVEAGIEAVTMKLGAGIEAAGASIGKKAASEGAQSAGKTLGKETAKTLAAKSGVKALAGDMLSEAFEEGVSEWIDPYLQRATYNPNAKNATAQEVGYAALIGALSGGITTTVTKGSAAGVNNLRDLRSGTASVAKGETAEILNAARVIAENEQRNATGYEASEDIVATLTSLEKSLAETNGEATTASQKRMIGRLKRDTVNTVASSLMYSSARNIMSNPEAFVERFNAYGMRDANGQPITLTVESLMDGVDTSSARGVMQGIKNNAMLRSIVAMDAAGRLMMDTAQMQKSILQGKADLTDRWLAEFTEKATDEEYAALEKALGIDLSRASASEVKRAATEYRMGNEGVFRAIDNAKKITSDEARSLPKRIGLTKDGVVRYVGDGLDIAVIRTDGKYRIYDYESGDVSVSYATAAEVNKVVRELAKHSKTSAPNNVIKIEPDSELAERIKNASKSKYSVIRDYLVEKFYGKEFTLSDGKKAIMDKRDAQELSHLADNTKVAELSNLKEIVENAEHQQTASEVVHNKFDRFDYYAASVELNDERFDILVNVGHSKTNGTYHIYDITKNNKKRDTANQVNGFENSVSDEGVAGRASLGLSRPVGNAIKNNPSKDSINNSAKKVNTSDEKSAEKSKKITERAKEAERIDKILTENVKEYTEISAPARLMVRKVYRDAIRAGLTEAEALSYSRVSAHSGVNVMFSKALCKTIDKDGNVKYADGYYSQSRNRIVINPEGTRSAHDVLIHELDHAIRKAFGGKTTVYMREVYKNLTEQERESLISTYSGMATDNKALLISDEFNAYFAEKCLKQRSLQDVLFEKKPSVLKKIVDFFTGASKAYSDDPKLAKAAKWYEARYRKMFEDFSTRNKGSNAVEVESSADKSYSFSSIANSFFGDPNITTADFEKRNYKETDGYKDYVAQCLKNMAQTHEEFDEATARAEVEKSIDGIVKVAVAMKKAGYDIYDDPTKRNVRDSQKRLLFSSLEPNSDYFTSSDISTICDKRQNFAQIYDDIVKAEEAKNVPKGKRFFDNVDNYFYIHKVLADKGLTQPCRQCYVESMRKNLAPMANAFIELVTEENAENTKNRQLYNQSGKNKGAKKVNNAATREWVRARLSEYGMSASELTVEVLTTSDGLADLKIKAPLIYEAFNSFYGQSKPKMPKEATPFRFGELTALLTDNKGKIKKSLVDKINATGGFRLQSYSDFQIKNYADVLSVIFEAGTLGLTGHAYTKVPAFLDATDGTNLKRNISVFMYEDGGKWKIDRNDSFPLPLEDIYKIVENDKSGNTGIIVVSQNADNSAWIMANDLIAYGIPFHKSGIKMAVVRDTIVRESGRDIKGYSNVKDHTRQQTEVWANTNADHKALTKVSKPISIYEEGLWDFENKDNLSKNELIRKNIESYIDECERLGYLPRFREYVMDNERFLQKVLAYAKELGSVSANATVDDISFEYKGYRIPYGYYKFLIDFSLFTPNGKASDHKVLSLADYNFTKAEKYFSDAEALRRREILQQFANGEQRAYYEQTALTSEDLAKILKQKRDEVVAEIVDDRQFAFAGVNAETANHHTLEDARIKLDNGVDSETIRKETGWFKGYDGKWRYEIDDSNITWHLDAAKPDSKRLWEFGERVFKLKDLMSHPALYEAYPELAEVSVWENPDSHTTGYVVGRSTDRITVRSLNDTNINKDFLIHEVQHIIQNIEGFASGASPEMFSYKAWGEKEFEAYEKRNEVASKLYAILRRHGVSIPKRDVDAVRQAFEVSDSIIDYNYMLISNLAENNARTNELLDEYYKQRQILNLTTPSGQYNAVAGEIEAYDTQARRRMTTEERKNIRPNIDRTDVIFASHDESLSIDTTENGKPVVVVNDDITRYAKTDKDLVKLVKESIGKLPYVALGRQKIKFLRDTKNEVTFSKYTSWLRKNLPDVYKDKMRLFNHPSEIVLATTNYINEGLKHARKDDIIDFARGEVLVDILGKQYTAEVIIGFTKHGECELHDVVNMTPTTFKYKKRDALSTISQQGEHLQKRSSRETIIAEENAKVNTLQQNSSENKQFAMPLTNTATSPTVGNVAKNPYATNYKPAFNWATRAYIELVDETYGVEQYIAPHIGKTQAIGLVQQVRASETMAQTMIGSVQYDITTSGKKASKKLGDGLSVIFKPISALGKETRIAFDDYLLHQLNVDRMTLNSRTMAEQTKRIERMQKLEEELKPLKGKRNAADAAKRKALKTELAELKKAIKEFVPIDDKPVFGINEQRQTPITADESRKIIDEYEQKYPQFRETAEKVWKYSDNLLEMRVKGGLIAAEDAEYMRKLYPHYVPAFRDKNVNVAVPVKGASNMQVSTTIKRARGGGSDILDIEDSLAKQTTQAVKAIQLNRMARAIYDTAMASGDTNTVEILGQEKAQSTDPENEREVDVLKTNQITFYVDGEKVDMKVAKEIYKGFKGVTSSSTPDFFLARAANKVTGVFKSGVTSWNPAFAPKNFIKDMQDAIINSRHPSKFFPSMKGALMEMIENGALWEEYRAYGGFASTIFDTKGFTNGVGKRGFESFKALIGESNGNIAKIFATPNAAVKNFFIAIGNANAFIEQLTRFTEYVASRKAGDDIQTAINNSAEVTTNFSRRGSVTKVLSSTVFPFLNASVQGADKLLRVLTGPAREKSLMALGILLAKIIAIGITPMIINRIMNGDDEDYENLEDTIKENYFLIKAGDNFIKIPRGRAASVFGGAFNRIANLAEGKEVDFKDYLGNVKTQVTPVENFSRSIFAPIKDVKTNTTWYGGEIEGAQFENVRPKDRYDESTSSIAIWIGDKINASPKKIHYLLDQYSGVIGDFVLPATTQKAEKNFLASNFLLDPVTNNKLSGDFYKLYEEATYNKKDGDKTAVYQLKHLNDVKSAISDMYDEITAIQNSDLSNAEKLQKTRVIRILINNAYKTAKVDYKAYTKAIESTEGMFDESTESGVRLRYTEITRRVYGAEKAFEEYNSGTAEKMAILNSAGVDYNTLYEYYFGTLNIDADYDKDGNEISGSRRKKIIAAINSLGLSTEQKLLLVAAKGYTPKDGDIKGVSGANAKARLLKYILSLKITKDEKLKLAQACGFEVKNGKIVGASISA